MRNPAAWTLPCIVKPMHWMSCESIATKPSGRNPLSNPLISHLEAMCYKSTWTDVYDLSQAKSKKRNEIAWTITSFKFIFMDLEVHWRYGTCCDKMCSLQHPHCIQLLRRRSRSGIPGRRKTLETLWYNCRQTNLTGEVEVLIIRTIWTCSIFHQTLMLWSVRFFESSDASARSI